MRAKLPPTAKLTFYPTIKPGNERGNTKLKPLNPNLAIIVSIKPLTAPVAAAFEHGEESQGVFGLAFKVLLLLKKSKAKPNGPAFS
jgi:hypothetical protein